MLSIGTNYKIEIAYETNNGYAATVIYPIEVIDYTAVTDVTCSVDNNEDDGIIRIIINNLNNYSDGYLIIRRSSHYSNFKH